MPDGVERGSIDLITPQRILDSIRDAVVVFDATGIVSFWNVGAERLFGIPAVDAIGRPFRELAPVDGSTGHEAWAQAIREGVYWEGDVRTTSEDGRRRVLEILSYPMPAPDGPPSRLSIIWDVTAERAGVDAARRLATLVEQADDAVYAVDPDGHVLSWNRGAERLTGFSAADVIGHRSPLAVPSYEERTEQRQRALAGETLRRDDAQMQCRDGTLIPVSYIVSAVPGPDGKAAALSVVARDDRPRRAAEQELRLREAILGAMRDAVVATTDDRRIILWGAGAERLFGVPESEAIGRRLEELVEFHMRGTTLEGALAVVDAGEVFRGDVEVTPRGGEALIGGITASSVVDADGRRLRISVIRDVTDERRAAETGSRLSAIIDAADDMIIASNLEGMITSWNAGATRLLGWEAHEIIGRTLAAFLAPESVAETWRLRARVLSGEVPSVHGEVLTVAKNGTQIPVWGSLAPIRDADGNPVGISAIARDLRQRKSLEEQLRQAQKLEAVGRLADGLAHDFNNVLTAVTGYAGLIESSVAADDEIAEDARQIVRATGRAADLTRSLLAFSRGKPLEPRTVLLDDVLEGQVAMLRRLLPERVELRVDLASGVAVQADPAELELILVNLALNAADAMPNGGRLGIETTSVALDERFAADHLGVVTGTYAQLVVTDTGVGMTDEVRAHIFEPFFTTKTGTGAGIGLATVHATVDRAGGTVWVKSAPGEGTSFRLLFPIVPAPDPGALAESAPAALPAGGTERILLVEDDVLVRALATAVLRRAGYELTVRSDPREAVGLNPEAFDLVLTDVVMPGLDGPALVSQLRAGRPDLRVLFMTGFAERDAAEQVGELSDEPLLLKPFMPVSLMAAVRAALDRRAAMSPTDLP